MNRSITLGLLIATGIALALRVPQLNSRPMHNDEAVNAIKFGKLWEQGDYRYDPSEHHGPSLYYSTLAFSRLTRAPAFDDFTELRLRLVPVCFGIGLILLLPLVADGLGRAGVIWAALFTAVSPAFAYYNRDYIHETLLVFFTFLAIASGWRYFQSGRAPWLWLAGASVGLMAATKETFVMAIAAFAMAAVLNRVWSRHIEAPNPSVLERRFKVGPLLAAVAIALCVMITLISSFFSNWQGPLDSIRTYSPWVRRAGTQSIHAHAWSFYLHRLLWFRVPQGPVWTEALIAGLACIGTFAAFARKCRERVDPALVRFVAFSTLLLLVIYSCIPYKTPWCLLGFWHGAILLAGVGAGVMISLARHPIQVLAVNATLVIGTGHLAWQAWSASIPHTADPANPYVYAQTSPDLLKLVTRIQDLAQVHPDGRNMIVKVIGSEGDYWPLPWYLRRFHHAGWWDTVPADPFAPVMVVSAAFHAGLDEHKTHAMVGYFALRPQVLFELYVEADLWRKFIQTQPREKSD